MARPQIQVRLLTDHYGQGSSGHRYYGWRLLDSGTYFPCSKETAMKLLANGAIWKGKKGTEPTE